MCVCDLDGTLLRSDATLSGFARDGLNQLIGARVHVTVASGRSLQAMRALLGLRLPVIGLNGALISELDSGRHLLVRALGSAAARDAVAILATHGASPLITSWDGTQDRVHDGSEAELDHATPGCNRGAGARASASHSPSTKAGTSTAKHYEEAAGDHDRDADRNGDGEQETANQQHGEAQ